MSEEGQPGIDPHDLRALTSLVRAFAEERDWEAFHTPKNLVMALAVEVAELMEPFQWLTMAQAEALREDPERLSEIAAEIADVAIYLLRLADVLDIEVGEAVEAKVVENHRRFPPHRVRGRATLPRGEERG